jgi:hypothetical protein
MATTSVRSAGPVVRGTWSPLVAPRRSPRWWAAADLVAKAALAIFLVLAVLDPDWGNMAGKAPVARAVTYPLWSLTVPVVWLLTGGRRQAFPWVPDTLVTITCFTDVLGNRLDLYDRLLWFDDGVHLVNVALLSAALLLLTTHDQTSTICLLERSIAFGTSAALTWELYEFVTFVTRSPERTTAHADTLGDLALGWLGAVVAAAAVAVVHGRERSAVAGCGRWLSDGLHRRPGAHCHLPETPRW